MRTRGFLPHRTPSPSSSRSSSTSPKSVCSERSPECSSGVKKVCICKGAIQTIRDTHVSTNISGWVLLGYKSWQSPYKIFVLLNNRLISFLRFRLCGIQWKTFVILIWNKQTWMNITKFRKWSCDLTIWLIKFCCKRK